MDKSSEIMREIIIENHGNQMRRTSYQPYKSPPKKEYQSAMEKLQKEAQRAVNNTHIMSAVNGLNQTQTNIIMTNQFIDQRITSPTKGLQSPQRHQKTIQNPRLSVNVNVGQVTSTLQNGLSQYGQQIINTIPLQLNQDQQQQQQQEQFNQSRRQPFFQSTVTDDEPAKPMFSIPTTQYDLRREIELQNKRLEEMKLQESIVDHNNEDDESQEAQPVIANNGLNFSPKKERKKLRLLVNTSHCRAELDTVQYVIDKHGYRESTQAGDGNILWYGLALRDHDIDVIRVRNALVNRYPLMDHFAKKNVFCVILSRLQRFFPDKFNFTPPSFLLPDEAYELEEYMRAFPNYTFIAKPSKGRGGDGIFLVKRFSELPKSALQHDFIVQRYIENPFLIDKKKFDFRIYVVIKGIEEIEAYLCDEGLARFCTSNYKKPDHQNIKNLYMHLTNFSLNKNSDKFVQPEEEFYKESQASKRLLTNIYKSLLQKGKDIRHLKRQIQDVAIKTVISLEPYLKNAYHCFINSENANPKCFQILGLDIMIDEQFNVWLIEINANPSLNVYIDKELPNGDIEQTLSELDKYVKCMLISDTLKLVGHTQLQKADEDDDFSEIGCLKRILPSESSHYNQFYIYSTAENIFQKLAGTKGCDQITSSQFQRLSKYSGLTNSTLLKAHYDIIYKNVVRKSENSQMDLNSFFDALEELSLRLYKGKDLFENLSDLIQKIADQM